MKHIIKNGDIFKDDTHTLIVIDARDVDSTVLMHFALGKFNFYWVRSELNKHWLKKYKYCGNSSVDINKLLEV